MGLTPLQSDHITIIFYLFHFKLIIHSKRFTEHASTPNASTDNTRILKTKYSGVKITSGNKAILFPSSLKTDKFLKKSKIV